MNIAFFVMILLGFAYALISGNTQVAASSAVAAGNEALETVFSLIGGFMFFGGVTRVLEVSGAAGTVVCWLRKPLKLLFGKNVSEEAMSAIAMNMSANMFGMGNAATPMGLKAARLLNPEQKAAAPAALCLLLVLNSSAIEFFPASVVALRCAAKSSDATVIVLPTLISTTVSCISGIFLCKLCERRNRR